MAATDNSITASAGAAATRVCAGAVPCSLIEEPGGAVVAGAGGTLRRARDREPPVARQSPRRPARPPTVGLRAPRLRRRARPPLPVDLPDPGDDRAALHSSSRASFLLPRDGSVRIY